MAQWTNASLQLAQEYLGNNYSDLNSDHFKDCLRALCADFKETLASIHYEDLIENTQRHNHSWATFLEEINKFFWDQQDYCLRTIPYNRHRSLVIVTNNNCEMLNLTLIHTCKPNRLLNEIDFLMAVTFRRITSDAATALENWDLADACHKAISIVEMVPYERNCIVAVDGEPLTPLKDIL